MHSWCNVVSKYQTGRFVLVWSPHQSYSMGPPLETLLILTTPFSLNFGRISSRWTSLPNSKLYLKLDFQSIWAPHHTQPVGKPAHHIIKRSPTRIIEEGCLLLINPYRFSFVTFLSAVPWFVLNALNSIGFFFVYNLPRHVLLGQISTKPVP